MDTRWGPLEINEHHSGRCVWFQILWVKITYSLEWKHVPYSIINFLSLNGKQPSLCSSNTARLRNRTTKDPPSAGPAENHQNRGEKMRTFSNAFKRKILKKQWIIENREVRKSCIARWGAQDKRKEDKGRGLKEKNRARRDCNLRCSCVTLPSPQFKT